MTELKKQAQEAVTHLLCWDRVRCRQDLHVISKALDEIEPLAERDAELERLWAEFGDVPMDPETECMDDEFLGFPAGTHREDIWHWFDERHSKGVAYLMHNCPG